MGAPRASSSSSSGLAVANVLGTGVELNGDGLDPPHGLVATAAARIVRGGRLVVVEKSSLAALLRAVQPMQAKRRCTAPEDIGESSMEWDSEFKVGSRLELARK